MHYWVLVLSRVLVKSHAETDAHQMNACWKAVVFLISLQAPSLEMKTFTMLLAKCSHEQCGERSLRSLQRSQFQSPLLSHPAALECCRN